MKTWSTGQICNLITLIAAAIRLLPGFFDQWPHGSNWIIATWYGRHGNRILSISLAVITVCLYIFTTSWKLIDVLSNVSVACESLLEILQTYSYARKADDLASYLPQKYSGVNELAIFILIFVLPNCLCFSPCFPINDRFKFLLFAIPIFISFCGQLIYNIRSLSVSQQAVLPRLMFTWNILRKGAFSTLLLILTMLSVFGIADIPMQRTFSAILRMITVLFPTAFFTKQPIRELLQALRFSRAPDKVQTNSEIEAVTRHATVTTSSTEQSISKLIQKKISTQAIAPGVPGPDQENWNMKQFHLPMYKYTSQQNISHKEGSVSTLARELYQETSVLGAEQTMCWV